MVLKGDWIKKRCPAKEACTYHLHDAFCPMDKHHGKYRVLRLFELPSEAHIGNPEFPSLLNHVFECRGSGRVDVIKVEEEWCSGSKALHSHSR